jgi:hypothetical protein
MSPMEVGRLYLINGKSQPFKYEWVEKDFDGWVDPEKFKPMRYDMCYLRAKNNRTYPGWWTGDRWDGLRVKPDIEIIYWKRGDSL